MLVGRIERLKIISLRSALSSTDHALQCQENISLTFELSFLAVELVILFMLAVLSAFMNVPRAYCVIILIVFTRCGEKRKTLKALLTTLCKPPAWESYYTNIIASTWLYKKLYFVFDHVTDQHTTNTSRYAHNSYVLPRIVKKQKVEMGRMAS